MPQIIIRGMEREDIRTISKQMVNELADVIDCPKDYFTIELLDTTFITEGEVVTRYPFVQVNWFDRGQAIQDKAAAVIDRHIRSTGYNQVEIYFIVLDKAKYYENGCHY